MSQPRTNRARQIESPKVRRNEPVWRVMASLEETYGVFDPAATGYAHGDGNRVLYGGRSLKRRPMKASDNA